MAGYYENKNQNEKKKLFCNGENVLTQNKWK